MKIFDELYVGRVERYWNPKDKTDPYVLGFATQKEDNKEFEKRKSTVDAWAAKSQKNLGPIVVENTLQSGFRVVSKMRRYSWGWHGDNKDIWRIEDPRGFQLEVGGENIYNIIEAAGISPGGEIPGKCLWGRDSGRNILLHEASGVFQEASANPKNLQVYLKKSDLEVGKSYQLAAYSHIPLTYLGEYVGYAIAERPANGYEPYFKEKYIKKHTKVYTFGFLRKAWNEEIKKTSIYCFVTFPKILGEYENPKEEIPVPEDVYEEIWGHAVSLLAKTDIGAEFSWKKSHGSYQNNLCRKRVNGKFYGGPVSQEIKIATNAEMDNLRWRRIMSKVGEGLFQVSIPKVHEMFCDKDIVRYVDSPEVVPSIDSTYAESYTSSCFDEVLILSLKKVDNS